MEKKCSLCLLQIVSSFCRSSPAVRIPAPDDDVARFLYQSEQHMSKLKKVFEDIASVKVVISYEDDEVCGFDEKLEYKFQPLPKVLRHFYYLKCIGIMRC